MMNKMKRTFFLLFFLLTCAVACRGQVLAVKSNLLYDATTTLNLGLEFGLTDKITLDVSGNYNPWRFGDYRLKHGLIQPEVRYWKDDTFDGHFFGLHGMYARYNVGGLFFNHNMRHNRYQGHLFGAGLSYGYQWILNTRWHLEASVGIGYIRLSDKKYPCADCGEMLKSESRNYFGPTKAAVSIIYIIK